MLSFFFFSSRRRHTRCSREWSSDVCSSDLPGTIMTFFPWPDGARGRRGVGQVTTTSFAVPPASLGYWSERLKAHRVPVESAAAFGEDALAFEDPDGLKLELTGVSAATERPGRSGGPVPEEHAVRAFSHVTLVEQGF